MKKYLIIVWKSRRYSIIPDVSYFEYVPELDKWAVGSSCFKSHEKLFDNSRIKLIGYL